MARFWLKVRVLTVASVIGLAPGIRGSMGQSPEDAAWREAQSVGTPEAFQGYLDQFPLGLYADQALASIILQARGIPASGLSAPEAAGGAATAQPAFPGAGVY